MRPFGLLLLLLMSASSVSAGHVDTLEVFSPAMRKAVRCVVITPDQYSLQGSAYPVLYLLHGYSGNYSGWLRDAPQLQQHADQYGMLIVCPDGGYDSWYLDSPVDSTVRYETHITQELVPFIDYYFHTRKEPAGRAIAGLSMGGHGALYLAIRHPELFGAAGSMAGGLDLRPWKKNNWDLEGVLGSTSSNWENWERASVVNLVSSLTPNQLSIIIDCGEDDFFLDANREMHRRLLAAKIPHEYTERPGGHTGEYWSSAVDFQILYFDKFFRKK